MYPRSKYLRVCKYIVCAKTVVVYPDKTCSNIFFPEEDMHFLIASNVIRYQHRAIISFSYRSVNISKITIFGVHERRFTLDKLTFTERELKKRMRMDIGSDQKLNFFLEEKIRHKTRIDNKTAVPLIRIFN